MGVGRANRSAAATLAINEAFTAAVWVLGSNAVLASIPRPPYPTRPALARRSNAERPQSSKFASVLAVSRRGAKGMTGRIRAYTTRVAITAVTNPPPRS